MAAQAAAIIREKRKRERWQRQQSEEGGEGGRGRQKENSTTIRKLGLALPVLPVLQNPTSRHW